MYATLVVAAGLAAGPYVGPRVQTMCPVMQAEEIDPKKSVVVEYDGVKIRLCCDLCVTKFRKDPAAYLDSKIVPDLVGKKLPDRGIEQEFCPVFRDRRVSAKDPSVTYNGVKVYVFNDVARQRFEKDPERFADPKLLPQLKK